MPHTHTSVSHFPERRGLSSEKLGKNLASTRIRTRDPLMLMTDRNQLDQGRKPMIDIIIIINLLLLLLFFFLLNVVVPEGKVETRQVQNLG